MTTDQPTPLPVDQLASAVQVTAGLIAGVRVDQRSLPTPCSTFDVTNLLDHLVGFATNFADRAEGANPPTDPASVSAGEQPAATYTAAADRLVTAYRSGPAAGSPPLSIVLLETITHGWDLARATGQVPAYAEDGVASALAAGRGMLAPEYRGEGQPFGAEVAVQAGASALDQLAGFAGRDPHWPESTASSPTA